MPEEVDTIETTEEPAVETPEPTEKEYNDSINDLLKGLGDYPDEPETTEEVETEEQEEEPETKEKTERIAELNVEGNIEKFNLDKPEEYETVIKYAQQGRHYQKRMHEVKEIEDLTNKQITGMGYQYLYLVNKGDISIHEPVQNSLAEGNGIPVYDDDGKTIIAMEYSDSKEYAKARRQYENTAKRRNEFYSQAQSSLGAWKNAKEKFTKNNPDVNVDDFIKNDVDPYYNALISFGAKPIPEDFFEVINFGKNRHKIIEAEVKKALKEYAKKPASVKQKVSAASPDATSKEDRMINERLDGLGKAEPKIRFR